MCAISQITLHMNIYAKLKLVYDPSHGEHIHTYTGCKQQKINVCPKDVTSTAPQCMLGRSQATLSSQQLEYQTFSECVCVCVCVCVRSCVCACVCKRERGRERERILCTHACVSSLVYWQICPSSIRLNWPQRCRTLIYLA